MLGQKLGLHHGEGSQLICRKDHAAGSAVEIKGGGGQHVNASPQLERVAGQLVPLRDIASNGARLDKAEAVDFKQRDL